MSENDLTHDLNQEAQLLRTFVDETLEDVASLEASLLVLETAPDDPEIVRELLRRAHTIKGNASCVGFTALTAFAHAYEDVLDRVQAHSVAVDASLVTLLLSGIDAFRRLLEDGTGELTADEEQLIAALAGGATTLATKNVSDSAAATTRGAARTLRVASEKLNRMLDLAGEIAIDRGRVQQLLAASVIDAESLGEVERHTDSLLGELRELIMRARMVPVGPTFRAYARTVRDLAASHGKNARLVTSGDDVEVDTTAVELLRDPLTHMIRNAIDHGLEPSIDRVSRGKSPVGEIRLDARHESGAVVIRVSDDGAGLDRRAIAARGRELGLEVDRLTPSELEQLIFEPGFSTAAEVSDLSGRGVGMDVVRRQIEALRGSITIESQEGAGTRFTIRLPLTLAVIDGFVVTAAHETYVVPMEHVVECVELPPGDRRDAATGVLLLRESVIPWVRLRTLFQLAEAVPIRENVLVVECGGRRAALVVDELRGSSQTVIKPLGGFFTDVPEVAGSSILGNGRVALILDVPTILSNLADASATRSAS